MPATVTIAHLTDVHLGPIAGFGPRHWNVKRLLGYANWLRHRRQAYQRPVLDRIVADLAAQAPDHIAVTGDLVNIGLPQEHIAALAWLQSLGSPQHVTVIPGNHDIYSRLRGDPGTGRWSAYMAPCAQGAAHAEPHRTFPFVRMLGRVAIVAVNSAVPTPPLLASGRLGEEQLAHLGRVLERLGQAEVFRLLLIHHPPLPGQAGRFRGLEDARALAAVLARHGAELVLHGHNHRNMLAWCACRGCAVRLARPALQRRAAGPLQPLSHRRAAVADRAYRPRPPEGRRPHRRAGAPHAVGRRGSHEKRSWEP
jgi:3',5'-cyclic AMP phosphodiesterase CpdA